MVVGGRAPTIAGGLATATRGRASTRPRAGLVVANGASTALWCARTAPGISATSYDTNLDVSLVRVPPHAISAYLFCGERVVAHIRSSAASSSRGRPTAITRG